MKKTLIVVDMQNDFIDMALGTPEAVAIVPAVKAKIESYARDGYEIVYTRDTCKRSSCDSSAAAINIFGPSKCLARRVSAISGPKLPR